MANELLTKMMPQNIEAEQAVIGAALFDKDIIPIILETLKADDFYRVDHRIIFECIIELFDKGLDIDIVTVADLLKQKGSFEETGGLDYLSFLINNVPTTSNIRSYTKIVEEKSLLRKLIRHSEVVSEMSYKASEEVEYIMGQAEKGIFDVFQNRSGRAYSHIDEILRGALERIEQIYNKDESITGIPTGFVGLDRFTAGLHNSDLIFVACRPGMGKTAFMTNIAQHVATKGNIPVVIFSLEMSREQLANRMLCSEGFIDNTKLSSGNVEDSDWSKIGEAVTILSNSPIYIDDTAGITMTEIRSKCRRLKMEKEIGLVVIDYIQLMESKRADGNRQQEISEISRSMKILAKELNVPVLCASQLSRAVEQRADKRPMLSDLRESGSIEQDADIVMFIYRDDYYNKDDSKEKNIAEISIAKHRNGSTGMFKLMWKGEYTKFTSIDSSHYEA
jgi:replicative DNA helicase